MMLNLAQGLGQAGERVDLVLAQATGSYLEQVPSGVNIVDLRTRRVLTAVPRLSRYLRMQRPAALLAALDHANIAALWARTLARLDVPLFVSVRNTLSINARYGARLGDRALPTLARLFYPQASKVIAVSRGVAEDLVSEVGLAADLIEVVYNPVVTPELEILAREPLYHPWLSTGAPPLVLAAGRLTRQKDFMNLVNAFKLLRKRRIARLLILGEGPERARLENAIHDAGLDEDVRLQGFVSNPFAYMQRASLFVLSSAWEGLPGVLVQAMACGTPVVSTDCPSGPREILVDGSLGPLVPVGDSSALANAILNRLEQPRSAILLRRRAADFSMESVTNKYLRLLKAEG
jgi:glycosyltransferase involved in cell wall biosynthesis